tara:strand:- start:52 stop:450 length:399 start_codon:yes stop_codon:yes gene_type:complete
MKSLLIQKMNGEYQLCAFGCTNVWKDLNGGSGWYKDREPLKSVDLIYTHKAANEIMGKGKNSFQVKKCDCFVKQMLQDLPLTFNRLGSDARSRFNVLNNSLRWFGEWVQCGHFDYVEPFRCTLEVDLNSKPE